MKAWFNRHIFLILAVAVSEILVIVYFVTQPYRRVDLTVLQTGVEDIPILAAPSRPVAPVCEPFPFYDSSGQALDPHQPYTGPAPVYRIARADCQFPTSLSPAQVLQEGAPFFPLHMRSSEMNEWVKTGESFPLWVEFSLDRTFDGKVPLDSEAISWKGDETQAVHIWLNAPNFDFSPANEQTTAQPLAVGRTVRQAWILAPKERAAGSQVIGVTLLELSQPPGTVDMGGQIRLQILPIVNVGPLTLALIPLAVLAGWALDRWKTALEIRALLRRQKNPAPGADPTYKGPESPG